jgi:hypothetical protein
MRMATADAQLHRTKRCEGGPPLAVVQELGRTVALSFDISGHLFRPLDEGRTVGRRFMERSAGVVAQGGGEFPAGSTTGGGCTGRGR